MSENDQREAIAPVRLLRKQAGDDRRFVHIHRIVQIGAMERHARQRGTVASRLGERTAIVIEVPGSSIE